MNSLVKTDLEEAEINELREYLAKQKAEHEGLSLEEAHGYMVGLICGPGVEHPLMWVSTILNGPAEFESLEHEERILGYLCRMYNTVARLVEDNEMFPEHYYPVHPARIKQDIDFQAIQDWCAAFMFGATAREGGWAGVETFQMILFPIMISGAKDDETPLKEFCAMREAPAEEVRRHFLEYITPTIYQLYDYMMEVKYDVDITMLRVSDDDEEGADAHECHEGCETVH